MRPLSMDLQKTCDQVIEYSFYALFFLVPLVMTPWNFELFEYNKMMLVYVLTIIITVSWLTKMVLAKRFLFSRTFFDIPLIIYLSSQLLSTVSSIDRHTSLLGYYSRFHGGLFSTISYLLLYWAFVSFADARINPNLNKPNQSLTRRQAGKYSEEKFGLFPFRKNWDKPRQFAINCLGALLLSGILISTYGILEHFGIDAKYWVQDVQNRVFSTLGQPNWLAAWLVGLIPLAWAFTLNLKLKTQNLKLYFYYLLSALFFLGLLFTKSRSALLALAPTYLIFWGLVFWVSKKEKAILKQFLLLSSLYCLLTLLAGSWFWAPPLKQILQKAPNPTPAFAQVTVDKPSPTPTVIPEVVFGGTESQTIRNIVWKGAIDIWKNYPLFGSGVETFAYSYYNFRPVEHNLVSEWDFLYNKAHNEYLNFLATTGAVGLGSYLLLIGWFVIWSLREIRNKKYEIRKEPITYRLLPIALLSGYLSILITNFFGFSVVPVALQFFLYPAFAMVLTQEEQTTHNKVHSKKSAKLELWQTALIIFCFLFSVFCFLRLAQFWYADILFARGIKLRKQGNSQQALKTLEHAVSLNPKEPVIRTEYGYSAALVAMAAHQEKQDKTSEQMTELAISQSDQALSISPRNVNLWKDKVKIHYLFSEIYPEQLNQAYQALLKTIELAPTDAKLWYNLGILHTKLGRNEEAIEALEKTVEMKKNYQAARYALALLYQEAGQRQKAIEQTEYILTYINSSVPEIRELYKNLTGKDFGAK